MSMEEVQKEISDTIEKKFIKESEKPKEYVPIWA